MNDGSKRWQDLLDQLATGEKIDWDKEASQDINETAILNQLKNIDAIQKVFATQYKKTDQKQKKTKPKLFEWGHLQVLELLGEGSFGEVYRAYDEVLNRDVALKLLKPNQLATFQSKLFIEEAQRVARVRNRHVLAIHGAGVNDNRAGFWADLIVGKSLEHQKKLSHENLLKVALAVADALYAVHEAGLVHGDVKAANIMQDQNEQYILMDFGAGLESDAANSSNHSVGSPMLMAPELFNDEDKSSASDIYAFGCLLFKLACDHYPVKGKQILDVMEAHRKKDYAQLKDFRPDLPFSMMSLIQSMIDPDANNRPSALEVKNTLHTIRNEPRQRRKKRLILGIISSLFIGFILAVLGLFFANQERQKAVAEQQKTQAVNQFLQQILGSAFQYGEGREVRVADLLDIASRDLTDSFTEQPHAKAAINKALGQSYQNLKLYEKSLLHLEQSLEIKKSLFGENHISVLTVMLQIAKVNNFLGRHQSAQNLCETIIEQTAGNPQWFNLNQNAWIEKASVLTDLGEFQRAEAILKKVLSTAPEAERAESNYPFLAMTTLSNNYRKQSKFTDALTVINKAADWHSSYPDRKPTNALLIKNQKAIILSALGRWEDAETFMKEHLQLSEQYYGKNNSGYLTAASNLGALLQSQNKLDEALFYLQQAKEISTGLKGEGHMFTLAVGMNLANTYVSLGKLETGEQLMRETLDKATIKLGASHVEVLRLEYNLAELLNNTDRYIEAEKLAKESLVKMQSSLGESHLITLLTKDNIAVSLSKQKKNQEALELHQHVVSSLTKAFGTNSPFTILARSHLVRTLYQMGRLVEAIAEQEELFILQQEMYGGNHPEVVESKRFLYKLKQERI